MGGSGEPGVVPVTNPLGQFAPDSPMAMRTQGALAPKPAITVEEMERQIVAYENYKRAEQARMEQARPGTLGGIARGALQGLTFGFGDEIVARVRSLGAQTYAEAVQGERDAIAIFREEHPWKAFGSEILGGLVVPVGGAIRASGTVARATRLASSARAVGRANASIRLARAATQGALYGGAYGAGSGEGGVLERLEAGVKAAPLGAVLGAGIPIIASGVGKLGRVTGVSQLAGRVSTQAKNFVLRAIDDAGLTPQQLRDRIVAAGDDTSMLADLMGEPGLKLAGGADTFNTPGAAKLSAFAQERVVGSDRIAGHGEKLISGIRGAARIDPEDITKTVEELIADRAARVKPFYKVVDEFGELQRPELTGAGLQSLLQRPGLRRAYDEAVKIAAEEGVTLPTADKVQSITLKMADYIKKGIDDVLYLSRRSPLDAGGLGTSRERAMKQTRSLFLELVDGEVALREGVDASLGSYRRARNLFEGPTKLIEALEDGQRLWQRKDLDTAIAEFGRLSQGEQEMFRRGSIDGLRSRLEEIGDSRDKLKGLFDSTADRRRLWVATGDAAGAKQFEKTIREVMEQVEVRNAVRGVSATAERTQMGSEIGNHAVAALTAVVANPLKAGAAVVGFVGGKLTRANSRANAISELLSAGADGRTQLLRVLDDLISTQQGRARRGVGYRTASGVIAGQYAGRE